MRTTEPGGQPTQGATSRKGLDTFSPCGPYLTLKEDVPDPHRLAIEPRLNGTVSPMRLRAAGTVEIAIERLGTLRNRIAANASGAR